jgi:hypothetical protein
MPFKWSLAVGTLTDFCLQVFALASATQYYAHMAVLSVGRCTAGRQPSANTNKISHSEASHFLSLSGGEERKRVCPFL